MYQKTSKFKSAGVFLIIFFLGLSAHAAKVTQANAKAALIDLEGSSDIKAGDQYYVVVGEKKVAIIEITVVKQNKAKAKIIKMKAGTNLVGATLTPKKGGAVASSKGKRGSDSSGGLTGITFGALLGYGMDSQSVNATNSAGTISEAISMSGSGFSLKGFADLPIAGSLGVMARAGFETFNVSGSSVNFCGRSCSTAITYLSGDLLVRYFIMEGFWTPYVAGGLGLHYPLSKSSNVLDTTRVATTTVFFLTAGSNINLSDSTYIPIQLEYGLFPPSNDVKTSIIELRVGYGMKF